MGTTRRQILKIGLAGGASAAGYALLGNGWAQAATGTLTLASFTQPLQVPPVLNMTGGGSIHAHRNAPDPAASPGAAQAHERVELQVLECGRRERGAVQGFPRPDRGGSEGQPGDGHLRQRCRGHLRACPVAALRQELHRLQRRQGPAADPPARWLRARRHGRQPCRRHGLPQRRDPDRVVRQRAVRWADLVPRPRHGEHPVERVGGSGRRLRHPRQ